VSPGPLVDNPQAQRVALVVRQLAKGGSDALAQLREPGQLDDAFVVVLARPSGAGSRVG
jgi:hypothetical protein